MKRLKLCYIFVLLLSFGSYAQEEDCDESAVPLPAAALLKTLKTVSEGLFKDVADLKVNHDGNGKLSVYYERGEPKLIKLTYKNGKGTVIKQISFEDMAKGIPLIYENPDRPGKAIVLEKGDVFKEGNNFNFNFKVRSNLDPEKHTSYPVSFESDMSSPKVSHKGASFSKIIISPGVSFLSWDGTFKKVEFKN